MNKGLTLIEVSVLTILVALLAALLIPSYHATCTGGRRGACANNLSQLYKMTQVYSSQNRGFEPVETGEKFWLRLTQVRPPLIGKDELDLLRCPVKGDSAEGEIDYRGPVKKLNLLADGDPIGADKVDNHGAYEGGNVLLKSGAVLPLERNAPLWAQCREKLSP